MVPIYISLVVMLIWLVVVSFFLFKTRRHYHQLTKRTGGKNIDEILEKVVKDGSDHEKKLGEVRKAIESIEKDSQSHYQKIGLVRFNPFDRVGGDQSFVLAILDKEDSGIVINFLYTREGVRIYMKEVKEAKAVKYELSQEEKEAIKKAQ